MDRRRISAGGTSELYLTACPTSEGDFESRVCEVYVALRDQLTEARARLFSERIFATADAFPTVEAIRREIFVGIDDGVPPTRVVVSPGAVGSFAGAQVHAIRSEQPPTIMRCCELLDGAAARVVNSGGRRWLFIHGMNALADVEPAEQARRVFFCTGCLLRQAGTNMKSVARTWLWLKDICDWYDEFNAARNEFFELEGLIDPEQRIARPPASTGIGLYGLNGAACTLDLIALPGGERDIRLVEAGGDQRSAFEYGSAFSRASVAPMPGGPTVFVSGTAAIDEEGRTEHVGQIEAQIDDTIAHIRSLLSDLDCSDEHVLTALAYCKTSDVERVFRERYADLSWPRVTMVGDVCRPDLLFEVEVTASPSLGRRMD